MPYNIRPVCRPPDMGCAESQESVMGNKVKHKTRKAVAKRFKKTKTGKILHRKASRGHLLTTKTRKRKRQLRAGGQLTGGDYARVIHHLPI
jgi:large subunit ribosomal protein L35